MKGISMKGDLPVIMTQHPRLLTRPIWSLMTRHPRLLMHPIRSQRLPTRQELSPRLLTSIRPNLRFHKGIKPHLLTPMGIKRRSARSQTVLMMKLMAMVMQEQKQVQRDTRSSMACTSTLHHTMGMAQVRTAHLTKPTATAITVNTMTKRKPSIVSIDWAVP